MTMRAGTATWTMGFVSLAIAVGSCGGIGAPKEQPTEAEQGPVGTISTGLHLGQSRYDVRSVRFDIVPAEATCDARPLVSQTRGFEPGALPAAMSPEGAGSHGFADGLFVLPVGQYRACATPLTAAAAPSQACTRADTTITVVVGRVTAVILVSPCRGSASGAVDVTSALNDPPKITALAISPSKFITVCQTATITAAASDPDNDALTYEWSLAPAMGATLAGTGTTATFTPAAAGDYTVSLTVSDVYAAKASLSFSVHVADATCEPPPKAVPEAVQALISARCSPCHTAGMSGMLKMDTAENTFTNLVGRNAAGAACTARVRVIPGDAATSYIVAKLKGETGICGMQMPRSPPPPNPQNAPLSAEELAIIEGWINSLPH